MRRVWQAFRGLGGPLTPAKGGLFPWVPVLIGTGIGVWFDLPQEPGAVVYGTLLTVLVTAGLVRWRGPEAVHRAAIVLGCLVLGGLAAGIRAQYLAAPVLHFRYFGPVEGRVVTIDRSQSDAPRLTLDQVVLDRVSPSRTPARVRVSLHGDQTALHPEPGMTVLLTAQLSAPEGPVQPDGFDFQRMAFFDQLGAVGYTRSPALLLAPPEPGAQALNRLRRHIRAAVEDRIAGDPGAFAAALVTGDRAGIGAETLADLRNSNLAHLLAISGLHMGLLAGFIFAALRYGLALIPFVALRLNTKKIAAAAALMAGAFYLALSGGNVATERAFVMVAVMLGAVLMDRRAVSLRSVAMAATVLLLLQPETLLEPGFQMSFAATVALVAGFAALQGWAEPHRMRWWIAPVFTLFASSLLAGLATAPVAAAHFNRLAGYGLIANLMAVPVMGMAVMPAAVVAALLSPFGMEGPALWVMEQGTRWILWVADFVSGLNGAVTAVPSPGPWVLPLMALGGLWLMLWRGALRFAGLVPLGLALALWMQVKRPPMLISADGGLVGVMFDRGRGLSAEKGAGFSARQWLENDGDLADQAMAAARPGFDGTKTARGFQLDGWRIVQIKGKSAQGAFAAACGSADLVIANTKLDLTETQGRCRVLDPLVFTRTGALAIWPTSQGELYVRPTHRKSRLWTGQTVAQDWVLTKIVPGQVQTANP